jgi:hypothetical protein
MSSFKNPWEKNQWGAESSRWFNQEANKWSAENAQKKWVEAQNMESNSERANEISEINDTERAERIKKEIQKLKKEFPNESLIELQNRVAEKFQKAKWYRGGNVDKENKSTQRSGATGWNRTTIMIWQVYGEANGVLIDVSGTRDKYTINKWHTIDLNKTPVNEILKFIEGEIQILFDDKGEPDKLTIEGVGISAQTFGYGSRDTQDDNIFTGSIDASQLEGTLLRFKVEHPEDENLINTDYLIKLEGVNLIFEYKKPKLVYEIVEYKP